MQHPFVHNQAVVNTISPQQLNLYNYLLIIQPTIAIQEKLIDLKKHFAQNYNCPKALHNKPHITLLQFVQVQMQEKKIVQQLQTLVQQASPFLVTINGFASFPTHTIYANVQTQNNITALVQLIKPIQPLVRLNKWHKGFFITNPHIIIAKNLQAWQYEKAWLQYSHQNFKASFMVQQIVLLKQKWQSNGYTVAATFYLLNKPQVCTQQASLFT